MSCLFGVFFSCLWQEGKIKLKSVFKRKLSSLFQASLYVQVAAYKPFIYFFLSELFRCRTEFLFCMPLQKMYIRITCFVLFWGRYMSNDGLLKEEEGKKRSLMMRNHAKNNALRFIPKYLNLCIKNKFGKAFSPTASYSISLYVSREL